MKLLDVSSNPEVAEQLLGNDPKLDKIELIQILYDRDGPRIVIRFDLPEYPLNPPEKWKAQGFNTVQLQVSLIGVRQVTQRGWDISNAAQMNFDSDGSGQRIVQISGPGVQFEANFAHLYIDKISAYKNADV